MCLGKVMEEAGMERNRREVEGKMERMHADWEGKAIESQERRRGTVGDGETEGWGWEEQGRKMTSQGGRGNETGGSLGTNKEMQRALVAIRINLLFMHVSFLHKG